MVVVGGGNVGGGMDAEQAMLCNCWCGVCLSRVISLTPHLVPRK